MNSKLILAKNIKLDRNYINVLNYNVTQMLSLLRNLDNFIIEKNNFNYIRETNTIQVSIPYDRVFESNYMAFQNSDYLNKWFFCFIDNIKWINPNTTEISFTIDVFSTFFENLNFQECFVIREHTNDDTIGINLVDEGLATGDFVCDKKEQWLNLVNEPLYNMSNLDIILGATEDKNGNDNGGVQCDGIYCGLRYYVFHSDQTGIQDLDWYIARYASRGASSAIKCMFLYPRIFTGGAGDREDHLYAGSNTCKTKYINQNDKPQGTNKNIDIIIDDFDGFVPKNNKVFTYPYNYLLVSNNSGGNCIYKYEDFIERLPKFNIDSAMTPGGSIRMIPIDYKNVEMNDIEGLNFGKLPVCSWDTDVYTNWLTQNGLNMTLNATGSALSMLAGLYSGNLAAVGVGAYSIYNQIRENERQSKIPPQCEGNTNCGDIITVSGNLDFHFQAMRIKKEFAIIIDNYFSRFGYKTNKIKIPNITGREKFNYVQIDSGDDVVSGNFGHDYIDEINNIFRKGVTIFHNHNDIGNYTIDNPIV